jgi:uncharacterized membrane protein HdeD (DUF308 family)
VSGAGTLPSAPDGAALQIPGVLRWGLLLVGAIAAVLGVVMILNPFATAKVLAIIIGIELILSGLLDLVDHRYASKAMSIVAGLAGIASGVLVIAWPGVTLWVIAVIVGISFVARGLVQVAVGFSAEARREGARGLLLLSGVLSVITGVLALAWPGATILVLAVLFGIRVLTVGLLEIGAGVLLGKVSAAPPSPA